MTRADEHQGDGTATAAGHAVIVKDGAALLPAPNLPDYERACAAFSWAAARARLDGLPGGGLNIAHEALDRHADGPRGSHEALRFIALDGTRHSLSYAALRDASSRFAHALGALGVGPGERVFTLTGRTPALYAAVFGALRAGCVVSPLFSAFGPEPIATRMAIGDARVLVTTRALYRRKVADLRERLPGLAHVILLDGEPGDAGTLAWSDVVETQPATPVMVPTRPDDIALLHFTSGTTGRPKGALHAHEVSGWLKIAAGRARPTDAGFLMADRIARDLIAAVG